MTVDVSKDRAQAILKSIRELTSKEVLIGVPAEGAHREPEPGEKQVIDNATIGYLMEFGDDSRNIPARPHLIPAVEGVAPKLVERLRKAGEQALSGKPEEIEKALNVVGLMGQNAVRAKITSGPFTPLSEVTLKRRRAKGRTGEKPLIDTGAYRRAHTYVVVKKGER